MSAAYVLGLVAAFVLGGLATVWVLGLVLAVQLRARNEADR